MKDSVRRTAAWATLAAMAALFCLVTLYGMSEDKGQVCRGVRINVTDSVSIGFVTENDVINLIGNQYGSLRDIPLGEIDLADVEVHLNAGRGVLKSEVYRTPDGWLNADIRQRSPILRIQTGNDAFYCDGEGYLLPVLPRYVVRLQVVDGELPFRLEKDFCGFLEDSAAREYLGRLVGMVRYLRSDSRWRENVSQIHVEADGALTLLLRGRPEQFLFGQPDHYEAKFARMGHYFTGVLPLRDSADAPYKSVNVQFKGQIVCKNQ